MKFVAVSTSLLACWCVTASAPLARVAAVPTTPGAGTIAQAAHDSEHVRAAEPSVLKGEERKLKGKFLHITDIHPDPFYKVYSSTEKGDACHRGKGPAGYYGAETSACDSPLSLVNATFDWLFEHIRDEIDFVVWTGDSARHDNDENIPRSERQLVDQNQMIADKMFEVFGKQDNINDTDPTNDLVVPIVPTFGNNDIMPHNIFEPGPNRWTRKYLEIWERFIPEEQRHAFQHGGWFYTEVIPGKLAVVSLNTMYFYDSNSAVDGCAMKSEPGYEHFEWLRIQLKILRERGMKAILIGHVPPARTPNKQSWDETCWQKFTLWTRQYRDVVISSVFGHMNIDHFMLQDFEDLKKGTKKGKMPGELRALGAAGEEEDEAGDQMFSIMSASDYLLDLRKRWSKIPAPPSIAVGGMDGPVDIEHESFWQQTVSTLSRFFGIAPQKKKGSKPEFDDAIGGPWGERYSVSLVSASVIPNYFPSFRVVEYNITGLEDLSPGPRAAEPPTPDFDLESDEDEDAYDEWEDGEWEDDHDSDDDLDALEEQQPLKHGGKKSKGDPEAQKKKKYKFKVPKGPSKTTPPGPGYSPQPLTLLGYTQYYANLTYTNNDFHSTAAADAQAAELEGILPAIVAFDVEEGGEVGEQKWKEGKHAGEVPKGVKNGKKHKPNPMEFKFEIEYSTLDDDVWRLDDMTVRSYLELAARIGGKKVKGVDLAQENVVREVEDANEDEEGSGGEESDVEMDKKKKKNKKKKMNKVWYEFVRRAFVGTMDPADIKRQFFRGLSDGAVEQMTIDKEQGQEDTGAAADCEL
ncbi:hypothetical protein BDY21DRAFT_333548 [Lineolata rhizophorae]|uniref:Endopolyphosphatase n=1 Tax=Lineolata rhizophorae TaxID=578093 RepID=A0A6A6PA58_9PEZI|nr:hypothetical protein BDY21DRAFT_333548 [Lineolata rhizophorae]